MVTLNADYARKLARNKAIAAGLSEKEIKQAGDAAAEEFRLNSEQFKSAQSAEIAALKNQGFTKSDLLKEEKANNSEYNTFVKSYLDGTAGTKAGLNPKDFRSAASTYGGEVAANVGGLLNKAANYYDQFNISTESKSGGAKIGVGLKSLVDYETGNAPKNVKSLIEKGQEFVGKTFTQEQLNSLGAKLKESKSNPNVFEWSSGGNTKNILYFRKNEDGSLTGAGLNRVELPEDKGFLGLGDVGGTLALMALGYFGGPALAAQFGASGAVAGGIAGGLLGAGTSALTGYDPLRGALTAGGSGAFAGGGGFGGGEGVFGGDVEAQLGGFYGEPVVSAPSVVPPTDYSLLGGSNIPAQSSTMGLGTGIETTLPPLPEPSVIGTQPVDYGLAGQTTPGVVGGVGLQVPEMPNIGSMGGGQGLTVPVEGGTVGQLGLTPTGATPSLGSPSSFINQPEVTGQPVLAQGTPASTLSIQDALRGANLAKSLFGAPEVQQPNMLGQLSKAQQGSVDYSGLLQLLAMRPTATGLLGTRFQPLSPNLASLLG